MGSGVRGSLSSQPRSLAGHNPERLCLLKGGIIYSSRVVTVSPNYARETLHGGEQASWAMRS